MLVCVPDVLSKADVAEFRCIMDDAAWEDGRSTAGAQSALVKKNEQLPPDGDTARKLGQRVISAITANPLFISAAIPLRIFPPPAPIATPEAAAPAPTLAPTAVAPAAFEPAQPITSNARRPVELSPWSMFLSADILVKAVMVSLAFASLVTWTIFLAKTMQIMAARRRLKKGLAKIARTRTLAEAQLALGAKGGVLSAMLAAALNEVQLSMDTLADNGIKERVASRFAEISRAESRAVRTGMGVLATIGATAPFVGLFGTVWGIMNSFIGISKAQTTNLAVVAPGIAEALLATAIGLVAAIPAVVIYNHFARGTRSYVDLVGSASGAVGRLLSRELDGLHGHRTSLPRAAE